MREFATAHATLAHETRDESLPSFHHLAQCYLPESDPTESDTRCCSIAEWSMVSALWTKFPEQIEAAAERPQEAVAIGIQTQHPADIVVIGCEFDRLKGANNRLELPSLIVTDIDPEAKDAPCQLADFLFNLNADSTNSTVPLFLLAAGRDAAMLAAFAHDYAPVCAGIILVNPVFCPHKSSRDARILSDAATISQPCLVIRPKDGHDRYARQFYQRLPEENRTTVVESEDIASQIAEYVRRRSSVSSQTESLLQADRMGITHDEAIRIAAPLPLLSLRRLYWGVMRACIKIGAKYSRGMAIGQTHGFDSGVSLDYVYRHQPEAERGGWLGRKLDAQYLEAIGWRGIRQRKLFLQEIIGVACDKIREQALPLRILDVAAGRAAYVLDALGELQITPESLTLRDWDAGNVAAGQARLHERGFDPVTTRFEQGDAFDGDALARITPHPTLAIISGLYELFPDNTRVRNSLNGIATAMATGGMLVYTNQPWHPQLAFIARCLTSHRGGAAWVMRRRSQAEMDALVTAAGFRKISQRIDENGIFTVSLAVKS